MHFFSRFRQDCIKIVNIGVPELYLNLNESQPYTRRVSGKEMKPRRAALSFSW
jgi:hypothetical protein